MKLNVRLLRRIKRYILEEPRRFFMSGIILETKNKLQWDRERQYSHFDLAPTRPSCGTAACIAGWAYILDKNPKPNVANRLLVAAKILGLKWPHAKDVFILNGWPEPYCSQFINAKTPSERARSAAARIEHLIKKGE